MTQNYPFVRQYQFNLFCSFTGQLLVLHESQFPTPDLKYLGSEIAPCYNTAVWQYISRLQAIPSTFISTHGIEENRTAIEVTPQGGVRISVENKRSFALQNYEGQVLQNRYHNYSC